MVKQISVKVARALVVLFVFAVGALELDWGDAGHPVAADVHGKKREGGPKESPPKPEAPKESPKKESPAPKPEPPPAPKPEPPPPPQPAQPQSGDVFDKLGKKESPPKPEAPKESPKKESPAPKPEPPPAPKPEPPPAAKPAQPPSGADVHGKKREGSSKETPQPESPPKLESPPPPQPEPPPAPKLEPPPPPQSAQPQSGDVFDKLGKKESPPKPEAPLSQESGKGSTGSGSSTDIFDKLGRRGSGGSSERQPSHSSPSTSEDQPRDIFDRLKKKPRKPGYYSPNFYYPYHYDYYYDWTYRYPTYPPYPRYEYWTTYYRTERVEAETDRDGVRPYQGEAAPYWGREGVPGSPEETLYDVRLGWLKEDVDLIMRHVREHSQIKFYYCREYTHTLGSDAFYNLTLDAFEQLETVRFQFTKVYARTEGSFYAQAEHVFFDPREEKRQVWVDYKFERQPEDRTWYLTQVSFAPPKEKKNSKCFIATAAYGDPLAPELTVLRRFRDEVLLTNTPGRWAVAAYYRISPPVAEFLAQHDTLRAAVRRMLRPVVAACRRVLEEPPAETAVSPAGRTQP